MVKIKDIVVEAEGRIELKQLSEFMDELGGQIALMATSEKSVTAGTRTETVYRDGVPVEVEHPITAGIQIEYITQPDFKCPWDFSTGEKLEEPEVFPDGMTIIQKYGKQGGAIMVKWLNKLKLTDTEQLQEKFYNYRPRGQRTGFARLYPFEVTE
jgi:hypothetical protein